MNLTCNYGYPICGDNDTLVIWEYCLARGVSQRHELRGDLFNAFDHRLSGRN